MHQMHIIKVVFYIFSLNCNGYQLVGKNIDGQHEQGGLDTQNDLDEQGWLNGQVGLDGLDGVDGHDELYGQDVLDGLYDQDAIDGQDGQDGLNGQETFDELLMQNEMESQNVPRHGICAGCKNTASVPDSSLFETLVGKALKHLENIEHENYSLGNIDEIAQKLDNGIKYYIDFRGFPTNCGLKNEKKCPLSYCYTELVHRERLKETLILCVECRSKQW